jgi:hypothetical protein
MLKEEFRAAHKFMCIKLFKHYEAEGEDLLSYFDTDDKTWVHHYNSETKQQYMEGHQNTFCMASLFWGTCGFYGKACHD